MTSCKHRNLKNINKLVNWQFHVFRSQKGLRYDMNNNQQSTSILDNIPLKNKYE